MKRSIFLSHLAFAPLMTLPMKMNLLNHLTSGSESSERMPMLFLGHGSPMNAIEENEFVAGFRQMATTLPKPKAILCVSAHWETRGTFVTAMEHPRTIHDFGGFPPALYEVNYPAPGSPELARKTMELVSTAQVSQDLKWGLDHGCWSVVKHLYPKAEVPVIQMSLDWSQGASFHYQLGKEIGALRKKGILIVGSGNLVHNLSRVAWDRLNESGFAYDWANEANETMKRLILAEDHPSLIRYRSLGKAIDLAIPTPEHFLPLLYLLGAQEKGDELALFNDKAVAGSLTMTSVRIG
ncbi:MAG: 4,5-DOPA dioxygenase extradiol [Marinilabiliales bacterium]|nr:4,5-DOPA dioxygenase extradiol [Marinilabiliales bacterium]